MSSHAKQGGLFSMMGTADAQLKPSKKAPAAQPAKQGAGANAGAKPGTKNKAPKTYPKISVYYAGNTIELPRSGMTEDEIHAFLEDDYRELAKEHSELIHDEKRGLLIAYVKGQKKGASALSGKPLTVLREPPEESSPDRRLFHLLAQDGVYEGRTTQAGTFVARVPACVAARSGFELSVPKPPSALLAEVVARFKATPRVERLANVLYSNGDYAVHWPAQDGTAASVEADGLVEDDETFVVVQLHSHGHLPAYFSQTDDNDEVRTGLYGVVGRLYEDIPEVVFRFSAGGLYGFASAPEVFAQARPGELETIARDLRPNPDANRKEGTRWASRHP